MGKFLNFIGTLLIVVVICVCIPIAVPSLLGYQEFDVITGSMEPELPVNSIVYVKEAEQADLKAGDIIAFSAGDGVVTHRIVSIDESSKMITTKGDANSANDPSQVAFGAVYGKVVYKFPFLGGVATFLSDLSGKLIALGLILLGMALKAIGNAIKKKHSAIEQEIIDQGNKMYKNTKYIKK